MISLALIAAAVVAQPAPIGLTVALSVKVPLDRERQTIEMLTHELAEAGMPTRGFDARCEGDPVCLTDFARRDGLAGLVVVTLGASGREVIVDLEAVRADDHTSVAQLTFLAEKTLSPAARDKLRKFAEAAAPALHPKPIDAPIAPKLEPHIQPAPVLVAARPPAPSKIPVLLLGAGALGAAGASIGLGLTGLNDSARATASSDGMNSQLTLVEATRLTQQANTQFTASLATGIAAGVLATAAVVWLISQ